MKHSLKLVAVAALAAGWFFVVGCAQRTKVASYQGESNQIAAVIQKRNLTPADVVGALSTYVPNGRHDKYIMFASGSQNGQVLVYGIPSMRLLDEIPVFALDSMAGWGYGGTGNAILQEGNIPAGATGPARDFDKRS